MPPKILVIAGSTSATSHEARLAALAAKELTLAEADVSLVSLADYPMPLYDPDHDAGASPENAVKLKRMMCAHRGVLIVAPELNASVAPPLKNALDWISCVRDRMDAPLVAYRDRVFAVASASNDRHGGLRGLIALRQMLEIGCGALVIPEQTSVADADRAFDHADNLKDERAATQLRDMVQRLVDMTQLLA